MGAVLGATGLLLLPWLAKPFHIDDLLFLRMAASVLDYGGNAYAAPVHWTIAPVPMWIGSLNPPGNAYILALLTSIFGIREIALHTVYCVFSLGSVALCFAIARRVTPNPGAAAALLACTPAFLVSATNVMADVPLLFFWLSAVYFALRAGESRMAVHVAAGVAAATAATFIKYFGVALAPLLAVYSVQRRLSWKFSIAWLVPIVALAAWGAYTRGAAGFFHPLGAAEFAAGSKPPLAMAWGVALAFWGGCLAWPVALGVGFGRRGLVGSGVCFALGIWGLWGGPSARIWAHWAVMAAAGAFLFIRISQTVRRGLDPESTLLVLWVAGTFVFSAFVNWSINARVILPAAPAAAILGSRWLGKRAIAAAMFSGVIGFWVAGADYGMAKAHQQGAERFGAEGVRFVGHWGFQYYMERLGAVAFDYRKDRPRPGDRVVVSTNNSFALPLPPKVQERLRSRRVYPAANPTFISTVDVAGGGAGFYTSMFGPVPFSFGTGLEYDRFVVEQF